MRQKKEDFSESTDAKKLKDTVNEAKEPTTQEIRGVLQLCKGDGWGEPKYISRRRLLKNGSKFLSGENTLTICLELEVFNSGLPPKETRIELPAIKFTNHQARKKCNPIASVRKLLVSLFSSKKTKAISYPEKF